MASENKTGTTIKKQSVSDKDLVELAGYHAYLHYNKDSTLTVNGNKYRVVHTIYKDSTGLDALTVKNYETGEYTIVYVGTDAGAVNGRQDIITDVQLLSKLTPAQIKAARQYFDDMEGKYGKISAVCGNSLGGGLADAVAVENSHVRAVTLNPALLPDGMVDTNKEFHNITNYFSKYDVLTKALSALQLHHRIPGQQYGINNGIPEWSKLTTNHTGYLKNDQGTQYYIIGKEGEPGFGKIYIDADEHIVTSVWTGEPLYNGKSERIEINEENLHVLATALQNNVIKRLGLVKEYLGNSVSIVDEEGRKFSIRVHKLQHIFQESFESAVTDPLFKGLATTGNVLKFQIDELISLLDAAEEQCKSLNAILNSPPAELVEHMFQTSISVESIFSEARNLLRELKDKVDLVTNVLDYIITYKIPELFKGGTDLFADAVVGELNAHYDIINLNKDKVYNHLSEFKNQVNQVASAFAHRDNSLAQAIQKSTAAVADTESVQRTNVFTLEESPYLTVRMKLKELQLETAYEAFTAGTHSLLIPVLTALQLFIQLIENVLETLSAAVKGATSLLLHGSIPGLLVSFFTNYDDKIQRSVQRVLEPLDEIAATAQGIRDGIEKLIIHYPVLLKNFKPYVDSALFDESNYFNVHLYNSAATAILEEMKLLFQDIVYQLGSQKSQAIEELGEVSKKVLENMILLDKQINRGTIN